MIDSELLEVGRQGEEKVSLRYQANGWHIMPGYAYTGSEGQSAPKLFGAKKSIVIPDLLAAKDGLAIWIECKTKSNAGVLYRKTGKMQHGFEKRHRRAYLEVEEVTGLPVYVVVIEPEDNMIVAKLSDLSICHDDENQKGSYHAMVYFDRDRFTQLTFK